MLRVLTVREAVLHSARMRLPSSWPASKVAAHVDNLLRALKYGFRSGRRRHGGLTEGSAAACRRSPTPASAMK